MNRTRHFEARMTQRGITKDLVDFVREFGEIDQDKHILGRRELERLIDSIDQIKRTAVRAIDKGGLVVVEAEGRLVTTYARRTFDRSKARASKEIAA